MKLFKRSSKKSTTFVSDYTASKRNNVTVEAVRKKLAGYQKTEGRACFIQNQDLAYLADGTVDFESVNVNADATMGFAIPFTAA